ncbi:MULTISPECIES: MerR family transcriptional regulator [Actinosynnema]|uniref:MerR family transcriptional regulator n=1 Tax=Actinosynnema TaxID=40566 RepID=UPI0020A5C566|nr:MerR family transcriptional regulator [Actinosynnema pretiosum]MCP2094797.1 transcriptional regulator, MerR family [Actinosynnema pretiosum]
MLIGELSEYTGVSTRLIRYYEQQGLLEATRTDNGYRHYRDADIDTVLRIRALLGAGLTLKTVHELLPCTLDATPRVTPCPNLVNTLMGEVQRLDATLAQVGRSKKVILDMLSRSGAGSDPLGAVEEPARSA